MTLWNLRSEDEWNALLRKFVEDFGMATALTDHEGNILLTNGERFPLCASIRKDESSMTFICSQTAAVMLQMVRQARKPIVDLCQAGLFRVVLPVIHDDELVGQITACGLASDDEEYDPFLVANSLKISEDEVMKLFQEAPVISEESLEAITNRLFEELAEFLDGHRTDTP